MPKFKNKFSSHLNQETVSTQFLTDSIVEGHEISRLWEGNIRYSENDVESFLVTESRAVCSLILRGFNWYLL